MGSMNTFMRKMRGWAAWAGLLSVPYVGIVAYELALPTAPEPPATVSAPVLMSRALGASGRTPADASPDWLRRRYELKPGVFPRWRRVDFGGFALRSDARADDARWTCYAVEWAWEAVARRFGGVAPDGVQVTAFGKWTSFQAYASVVGSEQAESYYDPNRREIVLCLEGRTPARRFAAIVHEVGHAVQHAALGRIDATWAAEGLADYLAAAILAQCGMAVEPDPDATLRERRGRWIPMGKLFAADHRAFKARGADLYYAQAYSVARYLIEERGMSPREVAEWTPEGAAELDEAWRAWVNKTDE